jgi:hypothetical protein
MLLLEYAIIDWHPLVKETHFLDFAYLATCNSVLDCQGSDDNAFHGIEYYLEFLAVPHILRDHNASIKEGDCSLSTGKNDGHGHVCTKPAERKQICSNGEPDWWHVCVFGFFESQCKHCDMISNHEDSEEWIQAQLKTLISKVSMC